MDGESGIILPGSAESQAGAGIARPASVKKNKARAQDFRALTFTLEAGQTIKAISDGCKYLTIYKASSGSSLQIQENIDGWEGNWTPLPYGFSVGFTTERGLNFRNPGALAATYTVLYGRGPFADNRAIADPMSYDGSGALKVLLAAANSPPDQSNSFKFYYLGDTGAGSGSFPPYAGNNSALLTYLNGKNHYFTNIKFRVVTTGQIEFKNLSTGTILKSFTNIANSTIIDTGALYFTGGTPPKLDVYLGPGVIISYISIDGYMY